MKDFFNIINCVFVIIGVIIGAGFASGKEIYTFFYIYGWYGVLGIVISIIFIGYVIFKTLKIIKKYDVNNYDDFLDVIMGNVKIKRVSTTNKYYSKKSNNFFEYLIKQIDIKIIIDFVINIFLIISFFVMCAGFSAYFKQEFGVEIIFSSIFISIFSYFILNKNINGIFALNLILIPIIIFVLIFLSKFTVEKNYSFENIEFNFFWIISSILYASYNSITLVSMLIPMKKYIKIKKYIIIISLLCIFIIFLLALIIYGLLCTINEDISKIELPTVYAVSNFGEIYKYLYGIIIISAITTTAISSAYGFLNNISKTKQKYKKINFLICIIAIFVSFIGFSNLVNMLYPLFGVLGLIQLIFILRCK